LCGSAGRRSRFHRRQQVGIDSLCLRGRHAVRPPQLLHLIREERLAWTLAKAVPVVMMLALRDAPWGQPWNPARDIGPKVLVLRAKCLLERWFFEHQDEDVEKEPEQRGIPEEAPIAE
jgi:hypothetical protein